MKRFLCALTALSFLVGMILSFSGCAFGRSKHQKQYVGAFDTVTVITGYAASKSEFEALSDTLYEKLMYYHRLFDIYNEYEGLNNLKTVNDNAGIKPVAVDSEITALLLLAKDMYSVTQGNINAAMGSVLRIWHEYRQQGIASPESAAIPPLDMLKEAALHTDINSIEIDTENNTVYISDSELSIDVGALAKGYAVEMVCEYAEQLGEKSLLLNVGGNVEAVGAKADGTAWGVGIASPYSSDESVLCTVNVKSLSVVTSGAYQRYYEAEGKRLHHIIAPDTLMPSDKYISVTVVSQSSALADALSTALFNMEQKTGRAIVESMPDTYALWITGDGSVFYSRGFDAISDIGA